MIANGVFGIGKVYRIEQEFCIRVKISTARSTAARYVFLRIFEVGKV